MLLFCSGLFFALLCPEYGDNDLIAFVDALQALAFFACLYDCPVLESDVEVKTMGLVYIE
jgi:hypothetical protein